MSTYTAEPAAVIGVEADHSESDLLDILERFSVHVPDEFDFVFVPAARTGLVEALLAWRDGSLR